MYCSNFGINLLDASLNLLALKTEFFHDVNGNVFNGSALCGAVCSLVFIDAAVDAL